MGISKGVQRLLGLLAVLLLLVPAAPGKAETSREERLARAREKYNEETVNVYREWDGEYDPGKINVCFFASSIRPHIIINIRESLQITDEAEMEAILELAAQDELYDEETYGTVSFMKAQWIAHNVAHAMASGSAGQKRIVEAVMGEPLEEILGSAEILDLNPLVMTPKRQMLLYELVELLYCH